MRDHLDEERRGWTNGTILALATFWVAVFTILFIAVYAAGEPVTSAAAQAAVAVLIAAGIAHGTILVWSSVRPALWRISATSVFVILTVWPIHQLASLAGFDQSLVQDGVNATTIALIALATREALRSLAHRRRAQRAERLHADAERRALAARLAPHTLFNMLNAIYSASLNTPDRVPGLILSLATMMRHLTSAADHLTTTLGEEMAFVRSFADLLIEQSGGRSRIVIDAPDASDFEIPNLVLASLFENAVTHGRDEDGLVAIVLTMKEEPERLFIELVNRLGAGTASPLSGLGSGAHTVRERLQHHYRGRFKLNAGPDGHGGYRVALEIIP